MKRFEIVFVVLMALSSLSWGSTLNNADFETPALSDGGWTAEGSVTDWTAGGSASVQDLTTSSISPAAQSGENTCGLNGVKSSTDVGAYIYQTMMDNAGNAIIVQADKTYKVKVWVGRRSDTCGTYGGILQVSLQESESLTAITTTTYDLANQTQGSWTQQTFLLSTGSNPAGLGTASLQLRLQNTANRASYSNWYYQQVVLDVVEISDASVASSPEPADEATLVSVMPTLSWTGPEAYIASGYDVYLTTDPNVAATSPVSTNQAGTNYTPASDLDYSTTYYWRIDSVDPNNGGTPVVHAGDVWSFITVSTSPMINTQPTNQTAAYGQTATFTLSASSPTTMTYAWYKTTDAATDTIDDDISVGTNSAILSVTATEDGYCYCKITNEGSTTATYSNVAGLAIERKVAHWTFNDLSTGYTDISGEGHDADPNGTPSFVAGAGASTGNGVQITPLVGWATAGTWNPSQYSSQFTLSVWAKWDGNNGTWQGLLGKRSAWGADTMMWQLESDDDGSELDFKNTSSSIASSPLTEGEWELIAVTFDGATATIYRNGVADGSGAFTLNNGTDVTMTIGASEYTDGGVVSSTFNGALDEMQIYNYAMTNIEVIDNLYTVVSGKGSCIYSYASSFDVDGDCRVNLADFAAMAAEWLSCGLYPTSYCAQ